MSTPLSKGIAMPHPLPHSLLSFAYLLAGLLFFPSPLKSATVYPNPLFRQVDSLIQQHGDYTKARALLLPLVKQDQKGKTIDPEVYFRLTDIEMCSHNFTQSQFYLRRLAQSEAYQNDADFAYKVDSYKAYIYSFTGRHDQAIIIIKALIEKLRQKGEPFRQLSAAYNALGISMAELQMEQTEACFLKSIEYGHRNQRVVFASYNNLIDFYIETMDYKAASNYLDSLLQYANDSEQPIQIISAKTKQSYLFSKIGLGRAAKDLMYEQWHLRRQYEVDYQTSDMIFDSYVYQANGDLDSALFYAEPVLEYALKKQEMGLAENAMHQLTELYSATGQLQKAIDIYQQLTVMQTTHNKINQIENISLHENAQNSNTVAPGDLTFLQGWVSSLLLCGMLSIFVWYKEWTKVEQISSSPRQKNLQLQLKIKNELLTKTQLARQQSIDFLSLLKTDIRQLYHDRSKLQQNINALIHRINSTIHFQSKWEEITLHFSERFPTFLSRLKSEYPKLTDTEVRHCMFLKLHLRIEEIAQILNIETTSVSSARYRLKKKVDLEELMKWE